MSIWMYVPVAALFIAINAWFVAFEVALLGASDDQLDDAQERGDPRAKRALQAREDLPTTLTAVQFAVTGATLGLGLVTGPLVVDTLTGALTQTGLSGGIATSVAVVVALVAVVGVHLVIAEMIPKSVGHVNADRLILRFIGTFGWFMALTRPIVRVVNAVVRRMLRAAHVDAGYERMLVHTPDELALTLVEAGQHGTIEAQDVQVMRAALQLATMDASAAMTPRVDMDAVADDASLDQVLEVADATGYTRLPVFHGDADHVVGLIHVKDILVRDGLDTAATTAGDLQRPITAVPEDRNLEQVLRDMIDDRAHALLVVDEFGGTAGMLTLEDVLEELVGDIADEFDHEPDAHVLAGRVWVLPGTARRDEVERAAGLLLEGGKAETLSGWVVEQLGRLPEPGDQVLTRNGWALTVLDIKGRRAGDVELRAPIAS